MSAETESVTRRQGTVADWRDDRGFGFITPDAGGRRVFVHVSAFPRGRRPVAGDPVTYVLRRDERNRPRAAEVLFLTGGAARLEGVPTTLAAAGLFLAGLTVLAALGRVPVLLVAGYGVLSVVAFTMYRADKVAAGRRAWRTPEVNLHAVALVGGWPGALVARRYYRHKTRKQPFRTVFWGTVVVNCAALAWFVGDLPLAPG